MGSSKTSRWVFVLLALILVFAFWVRSTSAEFGLPYQHHWDEPFIANSALEILKTGDFNPRFFNYGSLTIYLHAGVDVVHFYRLVGRPESDPEHLSSPRDIRIGDGPHFRWQLSHPSFYLWNRRLTALLGTLAVLLVFLLGRELEGPRTGLLGAALLAAVPYHVRHSAFITADVPASTLALASVWASFLYLRRAQPGWLLAALAFGGFAASAKYNLVSCLVVPGLAFLIVAWRSLPGYRRWLWPCLAAVPAMAFLLGTPYAVLDLSKFLADTGYEIRHYVVEGHQGFDIEPGLTHLLYDLRNLAENLSWPAAILAVLGLAVAFYTRSWAALIFFLPLLQLYLTSRTSVDFHRNVLVVYPFAALAFGFGSVALYGRLMLWAEDRRRPRRVLRFGVPVLLVGLIGWMAWASSAQALRQAKKAETRSRAVDLLNDRWGDDPEAPEVQIAWELRMHPLDLERLRVPFRERLYLDLACRPGEEEVVLVGGGYEAIAPERKARAEGFDRLQEEAGELLQRIPGGAVMIDRYSVEPEVQLRRAWPRREELEPVCAQGTRLEDWVVEEGARVEGEALALPPGAKARTPFFRYPPGRYSFRFKDAFTSGSEESPIKPARIRAVALERRAGRDRRRERMILPSQPEAEERLFVVELEEPSTIALQIEHLGSEESTTTLWVADVRLPSEADPVEEEIVEVDLRADATSSLDQ